MTKKKSFLKRFFSHNITLLVMAFLLAVIAWFTINLSSAVENRTATIENVPITLELPEAARADGLELFGADDLTASVVVKGNLMTTSALTAKDFQVTATQNTSLVTTGTYTLPIAARQSAVRTDFTIQSVTPSSVTVFVDKSRSAEFTIDNQITVEHEDEKNHYANTTLSQSKVMVTGPESQVKKISSVAVIDTLSGESDITKEENLVFLDEDGDELNLRYVTADFDTIEVSVTVLPIETVSLSVDVTNAPSKYPTISINPSSVRIAGPQNVLDSIENKTVTIGTLDFSKLDYEGVNEKFDITLPSGCKVISDQTTATVTLDLNSYYSSAVVTKISNNIDSSTYTAELVSSNNIDITVCGPEDSLSDISASDVSVITDFSGLLDEAKSGKTLSLTVPLKVTLNSDFSDCWVYGSYTANVNVTKK